VPNLPLPLLERSEKEIAQIIRKKVEAMKDVKSCRQLSVHMTGKRLYVEMHVSLDNSLGFEGTHKVALDIEREVKSVVPNARVAVNTEPSENGVKIWKLVKETAEGVAGSRGVHNIHIQKINGRLVVDLHLEVSANMTVKQAHNVADQVEKKIKAVDPKISEVTVHMESASDRISRELTGVETELESSIGHVAERFPEIKRVHGISVRKVGDSLHVVLRCHFDPSIDIKKAHDISNKLESAIRSMYPNIARIDIHEEPA
jgi:divalent metal cation (Fe/Co/Zn/Cd) transporter